MWSNSRRISSVGVPMIIARSSSALYPHTGAAGLGNENVPFSELDVVRDRVCPCALQPDLTAIPRRDTVGRGLLSAVRGAERLEHGERCLVARLQAGLGLCRSGSRVLLKQPVRMRTPLCALPDQGDLGLAFAGHQALDERRERRHGLLGDLAQRRSVIAENAGIAVLVGADASDPQLRQHARKKSHRMFQPRVLRVGLDPLEIGFRTDAVDLELGHEDGHVSRAVSDHRHRALGGKKPEAGEVADVVLVEEDVAGKPLAPDMLQESLASRPQLVGRDPDRRRHAFRSSRCRRCRAATRARLLPCPSRR